MKLLRTIFTGCLHMLCVFVIFAQQIDPQKALSYEIASATKTELIEMAIKQGLAISGSETDLRRRLYDYYQINAPKETKVELKNAQNIYSGQIRGLKEPITRLSGGVEVEIKEDDITHRITTENLLIYQKSQTIYASGAVRYELVQQSGNQVFFAKNMIFNTKKWQSLLVNIQGSTRFSFGGDEQTQFYLSGKKIQKTSSGFVILDNVVITSCDEEEPHYRFKFSNMWVLNEKEAVVRNMVMYMGNVPIFYLPFYYHGEDILPFNPVIGYRSPAGLFYNTTTYLYGEKKKNSRASSMFNIMGTEEGASIGDGYVKLMVDLYSMLGVFAGIGGYIPAMNTTFTIGVAYSRTIFDGVSLYPLTGAVKEEINTSNWFGLDLPFRFGVQLEGQISYLDFAIHSYSDPYFAQDFFFREEDASFFGFLGGLGSDNPYDEIFETESYLRYEQEWRVNKPGLTLFSIDYLNFELASTVKNNRDITNSFSPNQYFYIPKTVNFPNFQIRLEGDWYFGRPVDLREEDNREADITDTQRRFFLEENNLNLLRVPMSEREFNHSFFYRWQVNERLFYEPYTTSWNRPSDIKMTFDDVRSLSSTRLNFGIQSSTNDQYFIFRQGAQLDLQYLERFNESAAIDPSAAAKVDQSNRFFILSNVTQIGYYPFLDYEHWETTGFEYNLTARFFESVYDSDADFRRMGGTFRPDIHTLRGQVRYDNGFWWTYIRTDLDLPPDVLFKSDSQTGVGFEYWGFSLEGYIYLRENFTEFDSAGYGATMAYTPIEDFSLYQTTELDFFTGLNDVKVGMKLYGFTAEFVWEQRYLWDFSRTIYTWRPILNPDGSQANGFVPSYLNLDLNQEVTVAKFMDGQGKFLLTFDAEWKLDFVRYNDSILRFGFGVGFDIENLVSVRVSTNSINRATHLYMPFMRDALGVTRSYNFFVDLWDSFQFWDSAARQRSNFKLENIEASVMFDLHDWVLGVIYEGGPKIGAFDIKQTWQNQISFVVTWKAISPLRAQVNYDDDYGLYLGSSRSIR
ncbi:MAG: hypothetical protein ACRCVN_02150 [Spirochaetia bacterium]